MKKKFTYGPLRVTADPYTIRVSSPLTVDHLYSVVMDLFDTQEFRHLEEPLTRSFDAGSGMLTYTWNSHNSFSLDPDSLQYIEAACPRHLFLCTDCQLKITNNPRPMKRVPPAPAK